MPMEAQKMSECRLCSKPVAIGESIDKFNKIWVHTDCKKERQALYRRVELPQADGWQDVTYIKPKDRRYTQRGPDVRPRDGRDGHGRFNGKPEA